MPDVAVFFLLVPKAAAWRASWLVVAPHGAHNSNVVFMAASTGGGLVESFSCGHRSNT